MTRPTLWQPLLASIAIIITLAACGVASQDHSITPTATNQPDGQRVGLATGQPGDGARSPEVPELPFADNPDPALCGIPQPWTSRETTYLTGIYEGELIQPLVFLYDSHLRRSVVGQAPHGAEIEILLSQSNPTLDYFLVRVVNAKTPTEGWVPAPFVTFEPPSGAVQPASAG